MDIVVRPVLSYCGRPKKCVWCMSVGKLLFCQPLKFFCCWDLIWELFKGRHYSFITLLVMNVTLTETQKTSLTAGEHLSIATRLARSISATIHYQGNKEAEAL